MTLSNHGIDRQPIRYVVLAGNIREYRNWMAYNGIASGEALFVSNSQVLRARSFSPETTFVEVGTFQFRTDYQEVMETLKTRPGYRPPVPD